MSVNKNVNVCVATAQRFPVEVDANRIGQRPPPSSTEQRKYHTSTTARRNDQRDCAASA
jgi:hypothetical protein